MSNPADLVYTIAKDKLPTEWSLATISDLVGKDGVFVDGDWVESKDQDPDGDVRLIQLADIGDGEYRNRSERFLTHEKAIQLGCTFLEKGDVLIARMPDPLGRACIFPGDQKRSVTVVDVAIVRPAGNAFDARWLMYFVNAPAFRAAVSSMQSGSTRKRISRGNLSKIVLPVPPPDQQKRIVAEIEKQFSRLDEAVANLKRVKANLKRYKATVLKAAVEGKLTEAWRKRHPNTEPASQLLQRILAERRAKWEQAELAKMQAKGSAPKDDAWKKKYSEPVAPDTTGLPELPKGWVWASPAQLSASEPYSFAIGPFGSNLKVSDYATKGVPLVFVRNIRAVSFGGPDTVFVTHQKAEELRAHLVEAGDLLITKMGAPPGDVCIYPSCQPQAVITADCIKLRLATSFLVTSFFAHSIASDLVQKQILGITKGVAQLKVSLGRFSSIALPVPPLAEQQVIVADVERHISFSDQAGVQVNVNLQRSVRLRQSVLSSAFKGELNG